MMIRPDKYLRFLGVPALFGTERTKKILSVNPTINPYREEAREVKVFVHDFNAETLNEYQIDNVQGVFTFRDTRNTTWINIDGLRKADVEAICNHFNIHPLIIEDILSINQRPKIDEINDIIYCLLNMLYYNDINTTVEQEQISIILGKNFVISFRRCETRCVQPAPRAFENT